MHHYNPLIQHAHNVSGRGTAARSHCVCSMLHRSEYRLPISLLELNPTFIQRMMQLTMHTALANPATGNLTDSQLDEKALFMRSV